MNRLDYNYGNKSIPGTFRISASQISNFFDFTNLWFRKNLLGEDVGFKGSSASVAGTCVHFAAESYIKIKLR